MAEQSCQGNLIILEAILENQEPLVQSPDGTAFCTVCMQCLDILRHVSNTIPIDMDGYGAARQLRLWPSVLPIFFHLNKHAEGL